MTINWLKFVLAILITWGLSAVVMKIMVVATVPYLLAFFLSCLFAWAMARTFAGWIIKKDPIKVKKD